MLGNNWKPLLMVNWETMKVSQWGRMRQGCIFGFFSKRFIFCSFLPLCFFCILHGKVKNTIYYHGSPDHFFLTNFAFSRSQSQEGVILSCFQVFKRASHLMKVIPVPQTCFCLAHCLNPASKTGSYILSFTP